MQTNRPTRLPVTRAVLLVGVALLLAVGASGLGTLHSSAAQGLLRAGAGQSAETSLPPQAAARVWNDGFDEPALAGGWMWMREDAHHWSLSARPGWLRIQTQAQRLLFDAPNDMQNILLRPAPPGDWTITTQVAFSPTHDFHQAGLWVYRNDDNFLAVDRGFCAGCASQGNGVFLDSELDGVPAFGAAQPFAPTTTYLRIQRVGARYTASYSRDGTSWTLLGQTERPDLAHALVGISASNSSAEASIPSIAADFNSFQMDSQALSTYLPAVRRPAGAPVPVIVDDDGSPDGMIALLYWLRHPGFEVRAITVSCGETHPSVFVQNALRVLARLGRSGIPVAAGRSTPLAGSNAFPDSWRDASDAFWGIPLPAASEPLQPLSAAELIVRTLRASSQPVLIFISAPLTNLAEALCLDPGIAGKVRLVQVMGGAVYVSGNIHHDWPPYANTVSEWNIWVDPLAASEVLAAGLPIRFVPLDATNQLWCNQADADAWQSAGTPESVLASELLRVILASPQPQGVHIWDVQAAVDATDPGLTWSDRLHLDVVTAPGDQQGRTRPSTALPANATLGLIPRTTAIRARLTAVLCGSD